MLKKILDKFNSITSDNGKNWLLAFIWIVIFESISTIIEFKNIEYSQNYITHMPDGVFKEVLIAILLVVFLWYGVYNFIFVHRDRFFLYALYSAVCIYLFFTHDITFTLMLHNLNPFALSYNEFSFYLIIQLFIKIIIIYLAYKMLIAIKNLKSKNK